MMTRFLVPGSFMLLRLVFYFPEPQNHPITQKLSSETPFSCFFLFICPVCYEKMRDTKNGISQDIKAVSYDSFHDIFGVNGVLTASVAAYGSSLRLRKWQKPPPVYYIVSEVATNLQRPPLARRRELLMRHALKSRRLKVADAIKLLWFWI